MSLGSAARAGLIGILLATAVGCTGAGSGGALAAAAGVAVTPDSTGLAECGVTALSADVLDGQGVPIVGALARWSSLDTSIATVTNVGLVNGRSPGVARIVGTAGAFADTARVTVLAGGVSGLTAHPDTLTIRMGASAGITATLQSCRGAPTTTGVTFTSLDPEVAGVGATGLVTGVAAGVARVIATGGGAVDTVWVRVSGPYAFVLDTTIGGGGRYYTVDVAAAGFAYITRPSHALLARLDLTTRQVAFSAVTAGAEANGVTIDRAGAFVYSANQAAASVSRAEAITSGALPPIAVTGTPFRVAVSPDGALLAVSSDQDALQIFTSAGAFMGRVDVAPMPAAMAVRPNGEVIVTHLGSPIVERVDATMTTATRFDSLPGGSADNVAISPDGGEVFIASAAAGMLYIRDAATGGTIADVPIGGRPWGVAVTPNGAQAWVTSLDGRVHAISTKTNTEVASIVLGGRPRGIAIHPLGWGAVVANEDGRLHILR